ncbi:hypothetical protein SPF06_03425 [Sinomonas sp. JGH33]|uniref:Uncharacterized protein n=1 Tax=Sinomonas terricola TaxID=3110330 RepID=A0ABU5T2Q1_9MICC|nr:hypothetical protein [Sinomonas sp. JGH33]MEA5453764.1 hypothetical protein [Sinomonas sp. JGH33]
MNEDTGALHEPQPYAIFRDAIAVLGSDESIPGEIRRLAIGLVGSPEREQADGLIGAVDALPEAIWQGLSFADRQVVLVARVAAEHHAVPAGLAAAGGGGPLRAWMRKLSPREFFPVGEISTGVSAPAWGP